MTIRQLVTELAPSTAEAVFLAVTISQLEPELDSITSELAQIILESKLFLDQADFSLFFSLNY